MRTTTRGDGWLPHCSLAGWLCLLALGYFGGAGLAKAFSVLPDSGISIWPPGGLMLAAFLVSDRSAGGGSRRRTWYRVWVTLAGLVADMAANALWFHNPAQVALGLYGANLAGAFGGAAMIGASGAIVPFERLGQVVRLITLGGCLGSAIGATLGSLILDRAGIQDFGDAWPLWWLGDATGILVFAPLILGIAASADPRPPRRDPVEAALISFAVLGSQLLFLTGIVPYIYIVAPPLVWAAIRLRFIGTTIGIASFPALVALTTVIDTMPSTVMADDGTRTAISMQLFMAVSALTGLALAAVATGQAQAITRLNRSNEALHTISRERGRQLHVTDRRIRNATSAAQIAWLEMAQDAGAETPLRVSENFRILYDLPPDRPVTLSAILAVIEPAESDRLGRAFAGLAAEGKRFDLEIRLAWQQDGRPRWLRIIGMSDHDREAKAPTLSTVSFDISDRKRIEKALAESRRSRDIDLAELRKLYADAPMGLAMLDKDLRFVRINAALAEMNGFAPEDHVGRSVWDLVPGLRDTVEPLLRRVLDTGEPVLDVPIRGTTRARPGVEREWREQFYPLRRRDGRVFGIGIICEEVTEQVEMAERLRAREELYHGIFLRAGTGIALVGLDGAIQSCNPAFLAMLESSETSLAGKPIAGLVCPQERGRFLGWLAELSRDKAAVPSQEFSCPGPNGRDRYFQVQGGVLHDRQGQAVQLTILFADVTDTRQAFARQKVLVNELNHRAKNQMAIIQSIANRTFVAGADMAEARRAFSGRIAALALSLDSMSGQGVVRTRLSEIVQAQLSPFAQRVQAGGPDVILSPGIAQMCALILHELPRQHLHRTSLAVAEV